MFLITTLALQLFVAPVVAPTPEARDDRVVLITRHGTIENALLVEITDKIIRLQESDGTERVMAIGECIGFINPSVDITLPKAGLVAMTDGQVYRGDPRSDGESSPNRLRWSHRWFSVQLDLDDIAWIGFERSASRPESMEADVLSLRNGDRVEGFVTEVGDPILLESEDASEIIEIGLDRIIAVSLVNPPSPPAADVCRLWTNQGSIIDVPGLRMSDDSIFRVSAPAVSVDRDPYLIHFSFIAGVLFDPHALIALATMVPHDVEGPPSRYLIPDPSIDEQPAPVGLRSITLPGPLTVRYSLPEGAERFVGFARLPDSATAWADCELVVYDDDREVFRQRLNQSHPETIIDTRLRGSELTILVMEGAYGPIQDRVILDQAMIILDSER